MSITSSSPTLHGPRWSEPFSFGGSGEEQTPTPTGTLTPSTNVDVAAWSLVDTCPTNGLVSGTITLDEAYTGDITFTVTSHQMKVHGWNPTGGTQVVPVNDATSASFSIQVTQVSSADKYRVDITDSSPHLGGQLMSEPFLSGNTGEGCGGGGEGRGGGGGCGEKGTSTPTPTATPLQPTASPLPNGQFGWIHEIRENGTILGYGRDIARFDPTTNALIVQATVGDLLLGTSLQPVVFTPWWVPNYDPSVHVYSGPTHGAVDYGIAAPQFTTFTVVGPQVGTRLFVYNPITHNVGWIDARGVGPVGNPITLRARVVDGLHRLAGVTYTILLTHGGAFVPRAFRCPVAPTCRTSAGSGLTSNSIRGSK